MQSNQHRIVVGVVAGCAVIGAGAVAGAAVGTGPFASSDDATSTTSTSLPDDVPGADLPVGSSQTFPVGDAGFVTIARDAAGLHVVASSPAEGFTAELGDDVGREVRVVFSDAAGNQTTFTAELEDGGVAIRVAPGNADDGVPGDDQPGGLDNSGPGSVNSGPGSVNSGPDSVNSGPGINSGPGTAPATTGTAPATAGTTPATAPGHGNGADDPVGHDAGDDHGGSSGSGGSGSGNGSGHGGSSGDAGGGSSGPG